MWVLQNEQKFSRQPNSLAGSENRMSKTQCVQCNASNGVVCRRRKEGGRESELRATALVLHLTFTKDNEIFISTPEKCGACCITNKRRKNNIANQYKISERCLKHREDIPNVPLMKTDHFWGKWAVSYSSPTSWQMLQRRVSSPPHIRNVLAQVT